MYDRDHNYHHFYDINDRHHSFFVKQKTAYEMRISDWSSDVCSSDLVVRRHPELVAEVAGEVDPPDPGGDHAEIHAAEVHERKGRVGDVGVGEPRQEVARPRPGDDEAQQVAAARVQRHAFQIGRAHV